MTVARLLMAVLTAGSAAGIGFGFATLESSADAEARQSFEDINAPYDGLFHFVRIRYSSGGGGGGFGGGRRRGGGGGAMWAHDYPRAERNFLSIMKETTFVDAQTEGSNVLTFDDPELFKYPVAYIVEVGAWNPTETEAESLANYLQKGGFLIVDDFRDGYALDNLEFHLRRILPDGNMVMVSDNDDIFDSFFRIVPQDVMPPYGGGAPIWYGIYEDNDPTKRLMVIINYNNDIAEYWEFSDYGYYPIDLANEAYKLGVNYVVYGMTH
ncbi:MAG: DUF4159 domain-containing protein [Gemmatimonadetes bacterium]|nr:DUF4159 domain-containing protein [Gemmatimonadota bacterium]MDA1104430.1 DUF4159 domain-containing protein [Gemmatimonadota bacterium]